MKKIFFGLLFFISLNSYAQSLRLDNGDLKSLHGENSFKVEFNYEGMTIGKGDISEADYIKRKKTEYDAKEPGRGDNWEKAWFADRKERFEPQFVELFEKYSKMKVDENSEYTIIFKTTRTEPGYNVGPFIGGHASARIDADITIVETANRSNIIAEFTITNAPGRDASGYDYDTGYRIQEAYAKSGKELGKYFASRIK